MPTTLSTNSAALILPDPADVTNAVASEKIPDIRGLKDMVEIPTGNEWVWWLLVAVAVLVVAGIVAWFIRRHLAKCSAELAPPPPPPPHVVAWERLQRALELIHEAEWFCIEVSHIIRVYLEERFSLHAPDRTTEEFLLELQSSRRLAGEHKQLLANFLSECDMVKFARAEPPEQELRSLHEAASRLVGETQPSLHEEIEAEEEAPVEQ
ncbi:MAG: hypothetical protein VX598_06570 [Verrucomicrobiota bacterium]|nr:hypothetical protein [Verrucomicrobiota bacterium]